MECHFLDQLIKDSSFYPDGSLAQVLSDQHGTEGSHVVSSPMERLIWQELKPPANIHTIKFKSRPSGPKFSNDYSLNSQLDLSFMRELPKLGHSQIPDSQST